MQSIPTRSQLPCQRKPLARLIVALTLLGTLTSCASQSWLEGAIPRLPARERHAGGDDGDKLETDEGEKQTRIYETPRPQARKQAPLPVAPQIKIDDPPGVESTVVFNSMPLPQFIDSVFGVILKRTIAIDPQIAQRKDLVSMRSGKAQTPSQLYTSAKQVLRAYGITVQELPGLTRFVPDNADAGSLPEIRRGRALPDVPESLRPMFYLAELENTNVTNAMNWLRTAFQGKVTLQDDQPRNAIMLSGAPQNVAAAMQALQVLDQPMMRGRISARIAPVYWSAEELTRRLNDILTSEGYFVGTQSGAPAPAILLPVGPINSIIVFSTNQQLLDHILQWAQELDQPSQTSSGNYFIYPVRNADASDIASTLTSVMSSTTVAPAAGQAASSKSAKVVVDKPTNSLIIQSTAAEYQQWFGLLKQLDRPARSALVSVTVAEVKLTENEQFGFEWMVRNFKLGGDTASLTTMGAFNTTSIGGMAFKLADSATPSMVLNALAFNAKARVLSNPTVLTRSGEEASISIGDEVPIVTSQQSNANTNESTGGVLQTIQYRTTGVVLRVKPVVHSGGRIDLNVSQEVSSPSVTKTGVSTSPTISTKKLDTKLTVNDGKTVVLGGLMSENRDDTNSGVPYLKDIPLAGNLFKSSLQSKTRTELVVLITSYAVEDDYDIQSIADTFRTRFPWSAPLYNNTSSTIPGEAGKLATELQLPPSGALEGAKQPKRQTTTTSRSKPYIPKTASPAATEAAPGLTTTIETAPASPPPAAPLASPPPKAEQPTSTAPAKPLPKGAPAGSVVTDEALKQELLKAIKGQK